MLFRKSSELLSISANNSFIIREQSKKAFSDNNLITTHLPTRVRISSQDEDLHREYLKDRRVINIVNMVYGGMWQEIPTPTSVQGPLKSFKFTIQTSNCCSYSLQQKAFYEAHCPIRGDRDGDTCVRWPETGKGLAQRVTRRQWSAVPLSLSYYVL